MDSRRAAASMAKSAGGSDGTDGELPLDELIGVVTGFVAPVDAVPPDAVATADGADLAGGDAGESLFGGVEPPPIARGPSSWVVVEAGEDVEPAGLAE
ncbi:hypothetical protein MMUC44124_01895 [Mycolicibacterium mucogenicum DSM 44124]|uniref:Uncharacterized protein n=1 Tax=Mycolicibacterium mucogenicum DSM 44124 TaxID=1226753 RepID=A0A8H2J9D5_MYCMU|nr:hypothetical protein MMUC44124_01895 [Mycolicibacterium mucogenicum DSM 44124]